jgi:hypothetical protein
MYMFSFNPRYLFISLLLFITEVLIALFVHDGFIRPYFGDFLVVILLYCMVRTLWNFPVLHTVLAVLAFAYLLETLQYFQLVDRLGLGDSELARTVIGTGFAWGDLLAYTMGGMAVLLAERKRLIF